MDKKYGYCTILGYVPSSLDEHDFEVLIEYYYHQEGKYHAYITGKDVITGTPIFSLPTTKDTRSIETVAANEKIKRGKLIIGHYWLIDRNEMLERLSKMTKEDIELYVKRINELKNKYSQVAHSAKIKKKKAKLDAINQAKCYKMEKRRLTRLARTIK